MKIDDVAIFYDAAKIDEANFYFIRISNLIVITSMEENHFIMKLHAGEQLICNRRHL